MNSPIPNDEFLDVKKTIQLIIRKWYYFALSLAVCMSLAYIYIKTSDKIYEVNATIQLKDNSIGDKGVSEKNIIQGLGLLSGNPEIEDEIGILKSFSMTSQALNNLNFDITYYRFPKLPFGLGEKFQKEIYNGNLAIVPDVSLPQLLNEPVYISFPDQDHYRVLVDVEEARLYDLNERSPIAAAVSFQDDRVLSIEEPYVSDYLKFQLKLEENFVPDEDEVYYFQIKNRNDLVESYANKIDISPISEESNIVDVSIEDKSVGKAKDFLNELLAAYIQNDLDKKNQLGIKTIEFIDNQLSSVVDSLKSAEGNLENFRASSNILDLGKTAENLAQQLRTLEEEQATLNVQQEYYRQTTQYLRSNRDVGDIVAPSAAGVNNPFINQLLKQLADLSQEKAAKSFSSKPNSPIVQLLDQKISRTKETIIENFENLIETNEIALSENQRRIQSLRSQMNRLPSNERNLVNIERTYTLNDNIYNYLLEKRAEAGIALASNQSDKSVIDRPRMVGKSPVEPQTKKIMLLAILLGLSLPLGFIFLKEYFRETVKEKDDIVQATSLPVLGIIPRGKKEKLPVMKGEHNGLSESFRYLRISLTNSANTKGLAEQVIGVTSSQEGDGKSFCAANLAASFSKAGKKTLLICADLRKPQLKAYFDVKDFGLAEYIEKKIPLAAVVQKTRYSDLHLINAGKVTSDLEYLVENGRFAELIAEAKKVFDVIIVDTPPLGIVADYQTFAPYFNQHLFIVRQNETSYAAFRGVLNKLPHNDEVGLVMNAAVGNTVREYGYSYGEKGYKSV